MKRVQNCESIEVWQMHCDFSDFLNAFKTIIYTWNIHSLHSPDDRKQRIPTGHQNRKPFCFLGEKNLNHVEHCKNNLEFLELTDNSVWQHSEIHVADKAIQGAYIRHYSTQWTQTLWLFIVQPNQYKQTLSPENNTREQSTDSRSMITSDYCFCNWLGHVSCNLQMNPEECQQTINSWRNQCVPYIHLSLGPNPSMFSDL